MWIGEFYSCHISKSVNTCYTSGDTTLSWEQSFVALLSFGGTDLHPLFLKARNEEHIPRTFHAGKQAGFAIVV